MSPSHPLTLKDVQGQVQVKFGERHLQPTGRASASSWAGKAGHSALSSKAGQGRAAQAQVAAGCCKACQPQHGRDKKSQALHLSFTPSLSMAVSPTAGQSAGSFQSCLQYDAPKLSQEERRL